MSQNKLILHSVCLMIFIDATAIGLVFPILPELFLNKEFGLVINDTNLSREMLYSVALSLIPLSNMFGSPILGAISDLYSKKIVILFGLGALTLNHLLSITAIIYHEVWLFLITMALTGFFSGTYSVGNALISNISCDNKERISNFKLQTVASFLGLVVGPALSIPINKIKIINPLIFPFIIAFLLGVTNWFILYYNFKNVRNYLINKIIVTRQLSLFTKLKGVFGSLWYILHRKNTKILAVTFFLFQFGLGIFLQSLSLHLALAYKYSPTEIGIFFVVMAIVLVISMFCLQNLASTLIEYKEQMRISLKFLSILLILEAFLGGIIVSKIGLNSLYIMWLVKILFYTFIPFINLGFTNLFAVSSKVIEQGKIMGSAGQIQSISWFISSLMVSKLIENYNFVLLFTGVSFFLSYLALITFFKRYNSELSN